VLAGYRTSESASLRPGYMLSPDAEAFARGVPLQSHSSEASSPIIALNFRPPSIGIMQSIRVSRDPSRMGGRTLSRGAVGVHGDSDTEFSDSHNSSISRQGPPLQDSRCDVLEHRFGYPFGVTCRPVGVTSARSGIHVGDLAGAGFDDDVLICS
jgi:hypothetical protein